VRKFALLLAVVMAASLFCAAADKPAVEIFGGYSYFRADMNSSDSNQNMNGWDGAVTVPFNRYLGLTADIGGVYKTIPATLAGGYSYKFNEYNFLFGPTLSYRSKSKLTPFVHALFGDSHAKVTASGVSVTDNSFAMAVGGGLDYKLTKHFSLRPGQFDWIRTSFSGTSQNNLRYSVGAVVGF
jgi:opacity protein-like surface antigen